MRTWRRRLIGAPKPKRPFSGYLVGKCESDLVEHGRMELAEAVHLVDAFLDQTWDVYIEKHL